VGLAALWATSSAPIASASVTRSTQTAPSPPSTQSAASTSTILKPVSGLPRDRPVRVAVREIPPFDFLEGERWTGYSIELWRNVATELDVKFEFVKVATVNDQLKAVADGSADLAIGAISITAQREAAFDFSQPIYDSGLQIMTRKQGDSSQIFAIFRALFSPTFVELLLAAFVLLVIAGHLIWLVERRRNPEFPQSYLQGVEAGMWWAMVTLSTVGYGDKTAATKSGRAVSVLWMFLGIIIVAQVTAVVTTEATVGRLSSNIESIADLYDKKVATVAGTSSAKFVDRIQLAAIKVPDVAEAEELLLNKKVDAVIFDSPVLRYFETNRGAGRVEVVGPLYDPQAYGIVLPSGSVAAEPINQALLTLNEAGTTESIRARWFGE